MTGFFVIFHFRLFDKLRDLCFNNLNKFTPLRRSYPERWRDRPCESSATDRKIKVLIPADKQSNLEDKRARTRKDCVSPLRIQGGFTYDRRE